MDINDLLQKKAELVTGMRKILDKADEEKRDLSAEEQQEYDRMDKDYDKAVEDIKNAERDEARAKKLAEAEDEIRRRGGRPSGDSHQPGETTQADVETRLHGLKPEYRQGGERACIIGGPRFSAEHEAAFRRYIVNGDRGLSDEDRQRLTGDTDELRALQADIDTSGGYMLADEQFVARLIQDKDNMTFMRQWCTVYPVTNAASVGYPKLDADPADPVWTGEILTGDEDSTMSFEKRNLTPHPLAKRIKVSKKLLRVSAIPADALVRRRLAYKFAVTEENAYINGHGANRPLGIMIASDAGIPTGRDVSTGNTGTQIKADNLRECKYTLTAQYRVNCKWLFHRDAVKMISKLKDGQGNYLWSPGITRGDPDRLLGFPVGESEYMPNTFTTGLYVGILGDFTQYWIVDALTMTVQVVTELYAATNQNGYIGRAETDGMPIDSNAFVRVKMG